MKKILLSTLLAFFSLTIFAQNVSLKGIATDASDKSALIGAYVSLKNFRDTSKVYQAVTDVQGNFELKNVPKGGYLLEIRFLGYQSLQQSLRLDSDKNLGNLEVKQDAKTLNEIEIVEQAPVGKQKGDTVEYNASAFKVQRDVAAEDLIKKMPGVQVGADGTVQAQGENVQRILVDGKPFFGDDPKLAMKNLPAEMIERVQILDQMSDQSRLSGFDNGQTTKTINIITKADMRKGQFGKLYAGYGTDGKYQAGGNVNMMKDKRRISIIGMSNNINQQNFSSEDLLGVLGQSGGGSGGMGGGRGGMGGMGGGRWGMPAGMSDFLVSQAGGISTTHALGVNYADNWGKKTTATASYFGNYTNNKNYSTSNREYFLGTNNQFFDQYNTSSQDNSNHRLNLRLETNFDSSNYLLFRPSLSIQTNSRQTQLNNNSYLKSAEKLNDSNNNSGSDLMGYNFGSEILFNHKFAKKGRSYAIQLNASLSNNSGTSDLYAQNRYFQTPIFLDTLNQKADLTTKTWSLGTELSYTEPIGTKGNLRFSHNINYNNNNSDRSTYNFVYERNRYDLLDTMLTNRFVSDYMTNRTGITYGYNEQKMSFNATLTYQNAQLINAQSFPFKNDTKLSFNNLLPNVVFRYDFSKESNFRAVYRTSTNQPNVSQLQNVVNNQNPLQLSVGNPNLGQEFTHTVFSRYRYMNPETSRTFFALVALNFTQNRITNTTTIAQQDMQVDGIFLSKGVQLSRPQNLDGYVNLRSFMFYGFAWKKVNYNLRGGINYSRMPSLINGNTNLAESYIWSSGINLSSNISDKIDFTVASDMNYNIVKNTIQQNLNNNYWVQSVNANLNWIIWKGLFVMTDLNYQRYIGITVANPNFTLWNVSVGKKLFAQQQGEIKFTVFDMLNQNQSIQRNVSETFVEDVRTQVLQQYFMFTFTYNLRKFGK